MNKIYHLIFLIALFLCVINHNSNAQISQDGIPPSTIFKSVSNIYQTIHITEPDIKKLIIEDKESKENAQPYRIATLIPVNLTMEKSGTWTSLPDGGKIWRLKLISKGALALSIYYNNFWLPKGGKLFLYNEDKTQVIGAFTEINNQKSGLFATELIQGETITLEYFEPAGSKEKPIISISELAYAYRGVNSLFRDSKGFGDSDFCEVNINCSEGNDWQDEKRGIVRIYIKISGYGAFWCTGSLINNVRMDRTPYLLTADHCAQSFGHYANQGDIEQWTFYFNYEGQDCENPVEEPEYKTIVGASKKANEGTHGDDGSDFYLILLNQNVPDTYNPYYNGWNRIDSASISGVCIHHPQGDIKKISTYLTPLQSSQWNYNGLQSHWRVVWDSTENGYGVTEGGSSGSPIFDSNGRIVGALTGGFASCVNTSAPDFYGKISYSWESNGTEDSTMLKPWLDPDNTGIPVLDGTALKIKKNKNTNNILIYPNPASGIINIDFKNDITENVEVKIYNLLGETILKYKSINNHSNKLQLNISEILSGIYIIKIRTQKFLLTHKIIIE
ncbi:MAG: T9SS type A sorting domain-containing protein [Bacteroidales bacterium]|nr:T9SS type A sorting domain-containing protein [Bacteroidales bacterium]